MEKKKKILNLRYFLLTLFNSIFSDEFKVKIIFDFICIFLGMKFGLLCTILTKIQI